MKSDPVPASPLPSSLGVQACPVCRAACPVPWAQGRDRLFDLVPGIFHLYRCEACGCVFQHPLPGDSTRAVFYPEKYWWLEELRAASLLARLFRRLEKAYREFVVADHVRFLDFCARKNYGGGKLLLDIGCGSGTFLHVARCRGFVPHGLDASARAVEIAGKQYGFPVRRGEIGSKVWDGHQFDFITMFHVLEHLRDPRLGLKFAGGLLKPAGILVIQVPNIASIQARIFGSRWYGLDLPRHVINFSPKALGCLLNEAGFAFELVSRFSLRDNPASIASGVVPWLDPIRRKGRNSEKSPLLSGLKSIAYLAVFLLALPPAFIESAFGSGGTIWAVARLKERGA